MSLIFDPWSGVKNNKIEYLTLQLTILAVDIGKNVRLILRLNIERGPGD
jgi:hypothetical protein